MDEPIVIDCDDCVMQHTETCDDCLVTYLCARDPADAVILDLDERRAMHLLGRGGLLPPLQHRARG